MAREARPRDWLPAIPEIPAIPAIPAFKIQDRFVFFVCFVMQIFVVKVRDF